jgi:release factor glutamine methyltransferase
MTTIQHQISYIQSRLEAVYPAEEAEALAWWIAEELTGLSRTQLQIGCKGTTNFPNVQVITEENLREIISRLLRFEPVQYIFGHTLWYGLDLKVTPATLIPRPETAELVEKILSTFNFQLSTAHVSVLDIGTGSGCIAIAIKKAHPEWQVTGIDISPEAIEVAKENAIRNGVEVEFLEADIFDDISNIHYDIVVSNPPYICEKEKASMRPNVLDYEPATALFVPDHDPLRFYRRIAALFRQQPDNDQRATSLFFEINEAYSAELSDMLDKNGYTDIRICNDIYGKPRIIQAST